MARYSVSGIVDAQVDATETATALGVKLLGKTITSGRVLWLKSFWAYNCSTNAVLTLLDACAEEGATANSRRISIPCASDSLTMIELPAPGLKFATGCSVVRDATAGAGVTGNFLEGYVGGAGYEE